MKSFILIFPLILLPSMLFGQVNIKTDQFRTISLASEVHSSESAVSVNRSWSLKEQKFNRQQVARSCFCISVSDGTTCFGGPDDTGKSGDQLLLKDSLSLCIKFGTSMESQSQSVTFRIADEGQRYIWNCQIIHDIDFNPRQLIFSENRMVDNIEVFFRSKSPFKKSDLPGLKFDSTVLKTVTFKKLEQSQAVDGIHELHGILEVVSSKSEGLVNTVLEVVHPHYAVDEFKPENPYRKSRIPIFFDGSKLNPVILNFGAVRAGSERNRSVDRPELAEVDFFDIKDKLIAPFFLASNEEELKSGRLQVVFRPVEDGIFEQKLELSGNGKVVQLMLHGKSYRIK